MDSQNRWTTFRGPGHLVPEPKEDWDATLWILVSIGDAAFFAGWYELASTAFHDAMANCPGAFGNPFIHLRLGELFFEAGQLDAAANELIRAYALEGPELFSEENSKYLEFLAARADLTTGT